MKKERPILFSTDMVVALNEDRKGVTRRLKGLEQINVDPDRFKYTGNSKERDGIPYPARQYDTSPWFEFQLKNSNAQSWVFQCPFGQVGDILWVRESIWMHIDYKHGENATPIVPGDVYYVADRNWEQTLGGNYKKKPSIHMPRTACRLMLEITGVMVERIQDITSEDAIKEGIASDQLNGKIVYKNYLTNKCVNNSVDSFKSLWDKINAVEYPWEFNPWVWAVYFKKIKG